MIDAVLVARKPPERLLTVFGGGPINSSVVAWVAVVRAIFMRELVILPVKTIDKYVLPNTLPEPLRTCVHVLSKLCEPSQVTAVIVHVNRDEDLKPARL